MRHVSHSLTTGKAPASRRSGNSTQISPVFLHFLNQEPAYLPLFSPSWHSTIYISLSCCRFLSQCPSLASSGYFPVVSLSLSPLILFCFVLIYPPIFSFAYRFFFFPISIFILVQATWSPKGNLWNKQCGYTDRSFMDKIFRSSCNSCQYRAILLPLSVIMVIKPQVA